MRKYFCAKVEEKIQCDQTPEYVKSGKIINDDEIVLMPTNISILIGFL